LEVVKNSFFLAFELEDDAASDGRRNKCARAGATSGSGAVESTVRQK
jgi:hypothetical protein